MMPQPIQIIQLNDNDEMIAQQRIDNSHGVNIPIIDLLDEENDDVIEMIEIEENLDDSFDNMIIINDPDDAQRLRGIICPICRRSTQLANARFTLCGHLFCYDCIFQSYSNDNRCPLCPMILE